MTAHEVGADAAMVKLKKLVYKNRIRLRDFLVDFDKLRKGHILPSQFTTGLGMGGIDKVLSSNEIKSICDAYTFQLTPSLSMVNYKQFLDEVDLVFTKPNLEKSPLQHVDNEPSQLLDKHRFEKSNRNLGEDKETKLGELLTRLQDICTKRGVMLKPCFVDAAKDNNSTKLYGCVTRTQFVQALRVKAGLNLSKEETQLVIEKYVDDSHPDMVNYIAFANTVDPAEEFDD